MHAQSSHEEQQTFAAPQVHLLPCAIAPDAEDGGLIADAALKASADNAASKHGDCSMGSLGTALPACSLANALQRSTHLVQGNGLCAQVRPSGKRHSCLEVNSILRVCQACAAEAQQAAVLNSMAGAREAVSWCWCNAMTTRGL